MDDMHYEFTIGPENIIEVNLDSQANVLLMDDVNYSNYRNNRSFSYIGGLVKATPYQIRPPHPGHWHIVIDLGGRPGKVRAALRIL